jgi:hypothetical protein
VKQRARELDLREYLGRWRRDDACCGLLRALRRAAWTHWRERASHAALSSWLRWRMHEAAWNDLLGAVLHTRLVHTNAAWLHAHAPGDPTVLLAWQPQASTDQLATGRPGQVWTPERLRWAIAAAGYERLMDGALRAWRRKWHLTRRFVRVSALPSAPPPPPHELLATKRRAFLQWRVWRWVHQQQRASVALAFCTWYVRGRAMQLAMPITRDGTAQSPAIFWTGAAPIRDLLFMS